MMLLAKVSEDSFLKAMVLYCRRKLAKIQMECIAGSLQDIEPKLQDICKAFFTDSFRPGARHSLNDRGLGSWTCSCYIGVSFLGLPWICEEVDL